MLRNKQYVIWGIKKEYNTYDKFMKLIYDYYKIKRSISSGHDCFIEILRFILYALCVIFSIRYLSQLHSAIHPERFGLPGSAYILYFPRALLPPQLMHLKLE